MKSWQIVRLVAGTFVLMSLALGIQGSPVFVNEWWLAFTAFVGANLLQSALTKWCLMETSCANSVLSAAADLTVMSAMRSPLFIPLPPESPSLKTMESP